MEMHQIRYFLAVARTLNFTHAAEECNVTQPSLSRAIIKLEAELGGELFRRERGLTHMTPLGKIMEPLLQQTLEAAKSAKALATSYRQGGAASLSLALSNTVDIRVLIQPLTSLAATLPGLEIRFFRGSANEVAEHVKCGESEIAVAGPMSADWDRFRSWTLFHGSFHLLVHRSHRLANHKTVELSDLAGERLLGRPYCEVAGQFSKMLIAHGVAHLRSDMIAADSDALDLVEANLGIAVMPTTAKSGPEIRAIPIGGVELECPVMLHEVQGRLLSPAAAGLIRLARAADWRKIIAPLKTAQAA